jgi:hypothetical protein
MPVHLSGIDGFAAANQQTHRLPWMIGNEDLRRGFEPLAPNQNRCTKLLFRLGLLCVLQRLSTWSFCVLDRKRDFADGVIKVGFTMAGDVHWGPRQARVRPFCQWRRRR